MCELTNQSRLGLQEARHKETRAKAEQSRFYRLTNMRFLLFCFS